MESAMDTNNWRDDELRQKILDKIMDIFQKCMSNTGPNPSVNKAKNLLLHSEEKAYTAAANKLDYLRRISPKVQRLKRTCLKTQLLKPKDNPPVRKHFPYSSAGNNQPLDPGSVGSSGQTGQPIFDWPQQEKVYQRIQTTKEMYYQVIKELFTQASIKCQQPMAPDLFEKFKHWKSFLRAALALMEVQKSSIPPSFAEVKADKFEKKIEFIVRTYKRIRSCLQLQQQEGQQQLPNLNGNQVEEQGQQQLPNLNGNQVEDMLQQLETQFFQMNLHP